MRSTTGTLHTLLTSSRALGWMGLAVFVGAGLLLGASSATANARDSDGSRLQASSMSLGSTKRDTLVPPRDRADWRSFKVTSKGNVSISLTHKPAKATVSVALTDARGKSVTSASSNKGSASIRQPLSPGIYYVSVSSGSKVSYSLTVK